MTKRIAFASDHAGYQLRLDLKNICDEMGYETIDLGPMGTESVDYPDYADKMAECFKQNGCDQGVLICGSGIGISIAANRHSHLRVALCHDNLTARLSRQHNNANVLCLGARVIGIETAIDALKAFLTTDFEGGRHQRRIDKMS